MRLENVGLAAIYLAALIVFLYVIRLLTHH
jgi:hypothetical protein